MPPKPEDVEVPRPDGCQETSVNWDDDSGAVAVLPFKQHGIARVPLSHLKYLKDTQKLTDYERKKIDGNAYHGNLVFPAGKVNQRNLAGSLALHSERLCSDGTPYQAPPEPQPGS